MIVEAEYYIGIMHDKDEELKRGNRRNRKNILRLNREKIVFLSHRFPLFVKLFFCSL